LLNKRRRIISDSVRELLKGAGSPELYREENEKQAYVNQ
jgi:hypothetical protein